MLGVILDAIGVPAAALRVTAPGRLVVVAANGALEVLVGCAPGALVGQPAGTLLPEPVVAGWAERCAWRSGRHAARRAGAALPRDRAPPSDRRRRWPVPARDLPSSHWPERRPAGRPRPGRPRGHGAGSARHAGRDGLALAPGRYHPLLQRGVRSAMPAVDRRGDRRQSVRPDARPTRSTRSSATSRACRPPHRTRATTTISRRAPTASAGRNGSTGCSWTSGAASPAISRSAATSPRASWPSGGSPRASGGSSWRWRPVGRACGNSTSPRGGS